MARAKKDEGQGMAQEEAAEGTTMQVDLSDTGDSSFPLLPRGIYDLELHDLEFKHSQSSGNPMWEWVFKTANHENEEFNGLNQWTYTVFTPNGLPRVKQALKAIRCEVEEDDEYRQSLLAGPFDPEDVANDGRLVGATCRGKVVQRKFEGEMRNNLTQLLPPAETE